MDLGVPKEFENIRGVIKQVTHHYISMDWNAYIWVVKQPQNSI